MKTTSHRVWFQSREDLNFPRHFSYRDGRIGVSFTRGRHTVYEKTCFLVSEDQGETWLPDDAYPFDHYIHCLLSYAESRFVVKPLPQHADAGKLNKICSMILDCGPDAAGAKE